MQKQSINIVTLGCSKNTVDSEHLAAKLNNSFNILFDSNEPTEIVLINTCGFINDAKEESIDTILNFSEAKKNNLIKKIIVFGCLSERYGKELSDQLPEVDLFYGVNNLDEIALCIQSEDAEKSKTGRILSTPAHYAYLKISEGCNRNCAFCAIPIIKGKYNSYPSQELVKEAKLLADEGVKELIIIAQDISYYGKDKGIKNGLLELLKELAEIQKLEWIRLLYAYPDSLPENLIDFIAKTDKICNYLDIPVQHISDNMLKIMNRGTSSEKIESKISLIRKKIPEVSLRTSLLVGHPNETETDFNELIKFVEKARFERLGVFKYSEEEGTKSANLEDNISEEEKEKRYNAIMDIQNKISFESNKRKIGYTFKVIIDRIEGNNLIGRTEYDAPEVDNEVIIPYSDNLIKPGDFVNCIITESEDYDLIGEIL